MESKGGGLVEKNVILFRGFLVNWFNTHWGTSMFSKAECRVKWDSRISDILKSEFGVLQGSMLSPKLFTEFLQDISASFDQDQGIAVDTLLMVYLLFADDLVLFSESAEGLQKQLTALYSYASLWHIIVSIPKTKVLIFNERYTTVCGSFTMVITL